MHVVPQAAQAQDVSFFFNPIQTGGALEALPNFTVK